MGLGNQVVKMIETLKQKNHMTLSHEKDGNSDYEALKFTTNIDGINYIVASYRELFPHWKDSGSKGDYIYSVTLTDSDQNQIGKIHSTSYGSYLFEPNSPTNLDKLMNLIDNLEILPQKDMEKEKLNIINNIKSMRETIEPKVEKNSGYTIDWK